jgi:hypothetical protein
MRGGAHHIPAQLSSGGRLARPRRYPAVMQQHERVSAVARSAEIDDHGSAERAVRATLSALGRRLSCCAANLETARPDPTHPGYGAVYVEWLPTPAGATDARACGSRHRAGDHRDRHSGDAVCRLGQAGTGGPHPGCGDRESAARGSAHHQCPGQPGRSGTDGDSGRRRGRRCCCRTAMVGRAARHHRDAYRSHRDRADPQAAHRTVCGSAS